MRLFLLLLHFSLVHISWQLNPSEVTAELKDGFPVGSLLTIYFEHSGKDGWDNPVNIELKKDPSNADSDRIQFKLKDDFISRRQVFNVARREPLTKWHDENTVQLWMPKAGEKVSLWWRFDLYKISDSKYLPFLNGVVGFVRTMPGVDTVKSVHLFSQHVDKPNFDKTEVYINLRLPNKAQNGSISPTADEVWDAMNADSVEKNKKKVTEFKELDNFPIGKKIKLSVLMQNPPGDLINKFNAAKHGGNKYYSALVFANKEKTWGFGICNKYYASENIIKLQLFVDDRITTFDTIHWPFKDGQFSGHRVKDCTFSSSTDLLHILLERPDKSTIKMRIIYKDSPTGQTCEIAVPVGEELHLDKPLKIFGKQGATILHIKV